MAAQRRRAKATVPPGGRVWLRPTFVVGLSGSAGSVEALEQFFASMPKNSGMAFVVFTQLDSDRHARMLALLRRTTSMPVREIELRTRPLADTVYVIPAQRRLVLEDNGLRVQPLRSGRETRTPIDTFFTSLAHERGRHAIGVVLSGKGTDGAAGLRAIKEGGGAVVVQEPSSAAFDAMPVAALGAVVPDAVAGPAQLPAKLAAIVRGRTLGRAAVAAADGDAAPRALARVLAIVHERTGHDLTQYKRSALERRLDRRLAVHELAGLDEYAAFLETDSGEAELLYRELWVGATHFFRDDGGFVVLRDQALPALLAARTDMRTLRAWVAGCSSGEEAYSLAIVIREALTKLGKPGVVVQIHATDIDEGAIAIARAGRYSDEIEQHVTPERLSRYFTREEHGYRIKKDIRDSVVFAQHDLVTDPPYTHLDVLSCRNVLTHIAPELRRQVLRGFHHALVPDGLLVVGASESAASSPELFVAIDTKAGVLSRMGPGRQRPSRVARCLAALTRSPESA